MAIQAGNLKGSLKTPSEEQRMPASAEIEHSAAFTDDEDGSSAKKTKRWLDDRITEKQRVLLGRQGVHIGALDFSWTKYKGACMLNYVWNKQFIDGTIQNIIQKESA